MIKIQILIIGCLVACVIGHGLMAKPRARQALYSQKQLEKARFRPVDTYAMQCDNNFEFTANISQRNPELKCGICGEFWNGTKRLERGGDLYKGTIVASYKKGSVIEVELEINALHRGTFEFRVCSADGLSADPTMECFHKNKLTFTPGVDFRGKPIRAGLTQIGTDQPYTRTKNPLYIDTEGMRVDDITGIKGWQTYKVQLPKNLTCRHCVFQMRWYAPPGEGNDQLYYNCADVSITK